MAEPERREPLPELHAIPAWLWRRAPRAARIALVAGMLLAVGGAFALVPGIQQTKREDDRRQAAQRRSAQAARTRALHAEQRPHRGRVSGSVSSGAPAAQQAAQRGRMLEAVESRILRDAAKAASPETRGARAAGPSRAVSMIARTSRAVARATPASL